VNDPRGLAPEGWKIPSDEEWSRLVDFLGGGFVAGTKMKSTDFWADYKGESGNGTNESGFSGLPGGFRFDDGEFVGIGKLGFWWSSTEASTNDAWICNLVYQFGVVGRPNYGKENGFSVRCIKDSQIENISQSNPNQANTITDAQIENISQSNPNQANTITDAQNKLNTLVYFTISGSDKVLIAKLVDGKIYYNTATTNANTNPKWTVLVYYDNTSTILDLNNVPIMSYNGNNYRIINGFYVVDQGDRQYLYSNGFKLENNVTALAQFCGGQKFVIEKSQSSNLYYIKSPSSYYYDSNFDDIKNTQSNLSFEIVNSKSLRNDFAIIFFLLKFSKSDINPCE